MDATTARTYITQLYQQMLGRAPDAGGLEYWTQQLVSGQSPEQVKANFGTAAQAAGEKIAPAASAGLGYNAAGVLVGDVQTQRLQEAADLYNKATGEKLTAQEYDQRINPTTAGNRWGPGADQTQVQQLMQGTVPTTQAAAASPAATATPFDTSGLLKTPSVYSSGIGPDGKPFYTDPWGMKHTGVLQEDGTAWFPNPTAQRSGTAELYYGFATDPTQSIAKVTSPEGDKAVNTAWAQQAVKQGVKLGDQVGFTVPKDQLDYLYGSMVQDRRDNEKFAVKDGWNWKDTLGLAGLLYGGYNLLSGGFGAGASAAEGAAGLTEVDLASLYQGSDFLNGAGLDFLSTTGGGDLFSAAGLTDTGMVAGPGTNVADWISTAAAGGNAANVAAPIAGIGGWTTNLANSGQLINPTTGQIFDTATKAFLPSTGGIGTGGGLNTWFPNAGGGTTLNTGTANGTVTPPGTTAGTGTGTGTPPAGTTPGAGTAASLLPSATNSILDLLRSVYGIGQANSLKDFANAPPQAYDPFSGQRGQYQTMLSDLMTGKTGVEALPGYKAGLEAVNRGLATSGYLGSGNQMTALKDYGGQQWKDQVGILTQLAGGNLSPQVVNNTAAQVAGVQAGGQAVNTGIDAISNLLGGNNSANWLQQLLSGGGTTTNAAATAALPT